MFLLPTFPGRVGIHAQLIHFPLMLFFLAPLSALMAACSRDGNRRVFLMSTLMLMLFGTISTYVASEAGEVAAIADLSQEAKAIVERHREAN
jgi:uncharacterized membrane protein